VAGDKIGVQMGFKNVADRQALLLRSFQIDVHIALGINYHRLALRSQQIRSMGQTAQIKLLEVHNGVLHPATIADLVSNHTSRTAGSRRGQAIFSGGGKLCRVLDALLG
jgi:hypothetical protein